MVRRSALVVVGPMRTPGTLLPRGQCAANEIDHRHPGGAVVACGGLSLDDELDARVEGDLEDLATQGGVAGDPILSIVDQPYADASSAGAAHVTPAMLDRTAERMDGIYGRAADTA